MPKTSPTPAGTTRNLARQRRFWTRHASSWDETASHNPALLRVVEKVVERAEPSPSKAAVDLGCGSGQVTFELAPLVASVLAVDISEKMIELLLDHADSLGVDNVSGRSAAAERLELADSSVDLVVSNYVLHHLRDADKPVVVEKAFRWLRPGGRLVIGDMMFGRGSDSRDREIIASKLALLARKGPGGWWRIFKNAWRFLLRLQERPVSVATWEEMFKRAGFEQVDATEVVNEAAVVVGVKPAGIVAPEPLGELAK